MKKVLSISFLLVYINTAFGVGIDYHFCAGQLVDTKFAGFGDAHCACPVGSMPKGCCRNELHYCQADNHKIQAGATLLPYMISLKESVLFPDFIYPLATEAFAKENDISYNHCRFKYKSSCPLYILNNVFRI